MLSLKLYCKQQLYNPIMLVQTCMTFFIMQNSKEGILYNDGVQTTLDHTHVHCIILRINI